MIAPSTEEGHTRIRHKVSGMTDDRRSLATQILNDAKDSAPADVAAKLLPLVYQELRALAGKYLRQERSGHTLQPTALVHEAFLKLVDQDRVDWMGRTHFFAVCAQAMRRILIDHARAQRRVKRGGDWRQVALDNLMTPHLAVAGVTPEDLHDALESLAALDPRQAKVVELRFFGGLAMKEIAEVLDVSKRTVEDDWTHARAWLRATLAESNSS